MLGFASGLPLALTGQSMQAWLTSDGVDIATIGFLSLVGLPYTFKFLWAPLMDRFELPWFGRRRGWIVLMQLAVAGALAAIAGTSPGSALTAFAMLAGLVAFLAASQDIVVDAYQTDLLAPEERGLGSSFYTLGYRLAMILSGGIAFIWVDPTQGGGWTWPEVYRTMAWLMVGAAVVSTLLLPRLQHVAKPVSVAKNDLVGFLAVAAVVVSGFLLTHQVLSPLARQAVTPFFAGSSMAPALQGRWADLLALLAGIAITLPLAAWAARRAQFDTLIGGLRSYFSVRGSAAFLAFIVLYKLGDAFAGALLTPFLLKAMQFGTAEVGVVNKVFGLWLLIGGALIGGAFMFRLGLWRALMFFGILQMLGNLGFWWLAVHGRGALGGITLPTFDWGIVKLAHETTVDGGLLMAIAAENLTSGMGTAPFVALLMSLCNRSYSATQYALLSAFATIGRVWVGPLAGVLAQSVGWPTFFLISTLVALPALLLLARLRQPIALLERRPPVDAAPA